MSTSNGLVPYVTDSEIYKNFFFAIFKNYNTKEYYEFEISKWKNNVSEMIKLLKNNKVALISYNGLEFDDQIYYHIYLNPNITAEELKRWVDNNLINRKGNFVPYPRWQTKQLIDLSLDCMVINNYGPFSAKSTSLKMLQFNYRTANISDLPIPHWKPINTEKNRNDVAIYCIHDVDETEKCYEDTKPLIRYRATYGKTIGLNLLENSEVQLAKKVISKLLAPALDMDEQTFKGLGTYRDVIRVKDIIHPVEFKLEQNKKLLEFYENIVLTPTVKSKRYSNKRTISLKNVIEYQTTYNNGLTNTYGAGGLHGVVPSGIYKTTEDKELEDFDFGSFYPHLMAMFDLEPAQLPKGMIGNILMRWYTERNTKYPKKTHWDMNYAIKIIINLIYGLTKSEYFGLYDPQCTLGVCVNGMLQLTKMIEIVILNDAEVIYANTDGFVVYGDKDKMPKIREELYAHAASIRIPLEAAKLKALYLDDVNNYLAVDEYDNVKEKGGKFETYETIVKHKDYHKNTGGNIIQKAVVDYFIHDIDVRQTIYNHNDIYDFCYGVKGGSKFDIIETGENLTDYIITENNYQDADGDWKYELVEQKKVNGIVTNKVHDVRLLRYYISKNGSTLTKFWKEDSKKGVSFDSVEANHTVRVLQNVKKKDIYDFNSKGDIVRERYEDLHKEFYVQKALEIINKLEKVEKI